MSRAIFTFGLVFLVAQLAQAAAPAPSLTIVADGDTWTAEHDGDRALLLDRAVAIAEPGAGLQIVEGELVLVQGRIALIAGDSGITVRGEVVSQLLRNTIAIVSVGGRVEAVEAGPNSVIQVPGRPTRPLAPREVEKLLPYSPPRSEQPTFDGLELEAVEIEAGCVEICVE